MLDQYSDDNQINSGYHRPAVMQLFWQDGYYPVLRQAMWSKSMWDEVSGGADKLYLPLYDGVVFIGDAEDSDVWIRFLTDSSDVMQVQIGFGEETPEDPEDPEDPDDPENPDDPVDPDEPDDPDDPDYPDDPDDPIEPEDPVGPDDPADPDDPDDPINPVLDPDDSSIIEENVEAPGRPGNDGTYTGPYIHQPLRAAAYLPQTGEQRYPYATLAVTGALLVMAGFLLRRRA